MKIDINGMVCESCEKIIEKKLSQVDGINSVKASYTENNIDIDFDSNKIKESEINQKLSEIGYDPKIIKKETGAENATKEPIPKVLAIIWAIMGIIIIAFFVSKISKINIPVISANMGYGLLFLVGLLTGLHCVSMCGGFVLSYTTKNAQAGKSSHKSHLMYGLGKTLSYTIIGAIFGLIGAIIAFTPMMRGVAGVIAGIFLILFGLKMLNIFPILRKFQLRTPQFLARFVGKESKEHSNPLVIGLLNGLMLACGPLQAIYIMAAGTGSMIEGAKLLFVFGLGTLPIMLGFGYIASYLSNKATHRILKASGAIVIILGLIMVNRGLALTGTGYDTTSLLASASSNNNAVTGNAITTEGKYQVIEMDVTRGGWVPDTFVLKKGVPVKWKINGKEITGCNNAIQSPKLGLEFDIKQGEQVIEFTPNEEGVIPFSCWMGMIPGSFIVKDDININDAKAVQEEIKNAPTQPTGTCGGSAGSCGGSTCGSTTGGSCGCGGK